MSIGVWDWVGMVHSAGERKPGTFASSPVWKEAAVSTILYELVIVPTDIKR
jgi:hypothetical protein